MTLRPQGQAVGSTTGRGRPPEHAGTAPRFPSTAYIMLTFFQTKKCKHQKRRAASRRTPRNALIVLGKTWSWRRDSNPRPQPWQGLQAVYARASFSIPETAKPLSNKAFCCSQPTLSYPPHTRRFPLSCFPPASPASAPKAGEAETEQVSNDRAGTDYGQDYETHGRRSSSGSRS